MREVAVKLDRLRADLGGSRELMRELVDIYRDEAASFVESAATLDGRQLAALCHRLAGSTAQVGPQELTELAQEAEAALLGGGLATSLIDAIARQLPEVVAEMEVWVDELR